MTDNVHYETIILTQQCNLRCKYCYQTNKQNQFLSNELAIKRIEMIKEKLETIQIKTININFFGGEPFLNWSVFELFLNAFKNNNRIFMSVTTNGTLLSNEKLQYMKDIKNLSINISLDGNQYANLMRVSYDKKQTHSIIVNNVKNAIHHGIIPNVNMTLGNFNGMFFEDSLKFLKELGIRQVYLQFINYKWYRLNDDKIQEILDISERYSTDKFVIYVTLLRNSNATFDLKCNDNVRQNNHNIWHIFQPNGLIYTRSSGIPLGIPDDKQFDINLDMDLKKMSVLDIIDLNEKEIKYHNFNNLNKLIGEKEGNKCE